MQEQTIADGRIRLLRRIGAGGMGAVFEAYHEELQCSVAVKILATQAQDEDQVALFVRRFHDEAQAASSIDHPNVVKVLDAGRDKELGPFIAYELLSGSTLREELKAKGALGPEGAIAGVGRSLLSALSALHAVGVVHRDVKPDNLFTRSDGVYKLGDLGLALFEGRLAKTSTGILVGTPGYVAPEYLNGEVDDVGPEADIYAAAMVIVEALIGRLPFENSATMLIINEQLERDLSPEYLAGLAIPEALAHALAPALARSPGARPERADALLAVLEEAHRTGVVPVTISSPDEPLDDSSSWDVAPDESFGSQVARRVKEAGLLLAKALVLTGVLALLWTLLGPGAGE